jgi:hypothetical protein
VSSGSGAGPTSATSAPPKGVNLPPHLAHAQTVCASCISNGIPERPQWGQVQVGPEGTARSDKSCPRTVLLRSASRTSIRCPHFGHVTLRPTPCSGTLRTFLQVGHENRITVCSIPNKNRRQGDVTPSTAACGAGGYPRHVLLYWRGHIMMRLVIPEIVSDNPLMESVSVPVFRSS